MADLQSLIDNLHNLDPGFSKDPQGDALRELLKRKQMEEEASKTGNTLTSLTTLLPMLYKMSTGGM